MIACDREWPQAEGNCVLAESSGIVTNCVCVENLAARGFVARYRHSAQ